MRDEQPKGHGESTSAKSRADAGAPEIEITPAMIEAGVDCFYELPELLGPSPEQLREAISRAFCAMLRVHRARRAGVN